MKITKLRKPKYKGEWLLAAYLCVTVTTITALWWPYFGVGALPFSVVLHLALFAAVHSHYTNGP